MSNLSVSGFKQYEKWFNMEMMVPVSGVVAAPSVEQPKVELV